MKLRLKLVLPITLALFNAISFAGITVINNSYEEVTFSITTTGLGNSRITEITVIPYSKKSNDEVSEVAKLNGHDTISAWAGAMYCGASNNVMNLRVLYDGSKCSVK